LHSLYTYHIAELKLNRIVLATTVFLNYTVTDLCNVNVNVNAKKVKFKCRK